MNSRTQAFEHPLLKAFSKRIEPTLTPSIQIKATVSDEASYWSSALASERYYWPQDMPHPSNAAGEPLFLLAQINFQEVPAVADFPTEGILQFYIDANDDLWGWSLDEPTAQTGFQVIFHPNPNLDINQLQTDLPEPQWQNAPVGESHVLQFEKREQYMSINDHRFLKTILQVNDFEDLSQVFETADKSDAFFEIYDEHFSATGHRLGGYPYFTQSDPREIDAFSDYVLLLQIDTDGEQSIMWGDMGVANFFIHPNDLKRRDFSKVLYNWDCG